MRLLQASFKDHCYHTWGGSKKNVMSLWNLAIGEEENKFILLYFFWFSDLPSGNYIQEDVSRCSYLCEAGQDCCDVMASCKCGTHTGQYDCVCERGYYGKGLQHECTGMKKHGNLKYKQGQLVTVNVWSTFLISSSDWKSMLVFLFIKYK